MEGAALVLEVMEGREGVLFILPVILFSQWNGFSILHIIIYLPLSPCHFRDIEFQWALLFSFVGFMSYLIFCLYCIYLLLHTFITCIVSKKLVNYN